MAKSPPAPARMPNNALLLCVVMLLLVVALIQLRCVRSEALGLGQPCACETAIAVASVAGRRTTRCNVHQNEHVQENSTPESPAHLRQNSYIHNTQTHTNSQTTTTRTRIHTIGTPKIVHGLLPGGHRCSDSPQHRRLRPWWMRTERENVDFNTKEKRRWLLDGCFVRVIGDENITCYFCFAPCWCEWKTCV